MILWFYDYRHCREQHWSMACFRCSFEGWNGPFKAGGASLFSPRRPEGFSLSHSESEWWLHSSYVKCHLGAKQLPSKQCWFWGFLLSQPLLVLASKSSFPLRNNHSIWSIYCRFLRSQMQRTHYSLFLLHSFCTVGGSGSGRHWDACLYKLHCIEGFSPRFTFRLLRCTGAQVAEQDSYCAGCWTNIAEKHPVFLVPQGF